MLDVILAIVITVIASQGINLIVILKCIDVIEGYHKRECSYLRTKQKENIIKPQ